MAKADGGPQGPPLDSVRLDVWLDVSCLYRTRSEAQRACRSGQVEINGQAGKPHRLVRAGDRIELSRPFGDKQAIVVTAIADRSIPRTQARALYDDHTPRPTPDQIAARRAERVFRAAQNAAGRPDTQQRRAVRKLRGY